MDLIVKHTYNSGFFSCCVIKLCMIQLYINKFRILPVSVNSSELFYLYKIDKSKDITYDFFIHQNPYDLISINPIYIVYQLTTNSENMVALTLI